MRNVIFCCKINDSCIIFSESSHFKRNVIIFKHFTNKTAIKAIKITQNSAFFEEQQKASCSSLLLKPLKNVAFRADPVPLH